MTHNTYRGLSPILPPVVRPSYQVAYVEPPTEEVKQRSETYEARLNFRVNRYDIERDYMNNAAVLAEVDQIIREVHQDENLTVNQFKVTGYASPEGASAHNMTLSENRAKSFVKYVQDQHAIPQQVVQINWKGDDWEGLRRIMEESEFSSKNQVLGILDGTSDAQQRKNQLRNLGSAYRTLLDDYYPYLRRNEYTIGYIARPFSVEEARALVKTKPQQLSLNEMYLVANTYPKNSAEFKEVFDIAARLYPNDPYANLNSAALDIENGAYDTALDRAQKVDLPESWNNIGLIYIQKGDYTQAAQYLRRAAEAGLPIARENLNQLNTWLEDPE
ncbi:MAG: OmpA family protein [Rikenellaceae bacterium]|nr:OmpA family protein [Rikenellaceae bacterium]